MKALNIIAAAIGAAVIGVGCTNTQPAEMETAILQDKGSVKAVDVPDAEMDWDYDVEYVTGGVADEVKDAINGTIITKCILGSEQGEGLTDVPAACKMWAEDHERGYINDTSASQVELEEGPTFIYNWEFGMRGVFEAGPTGKDWVNYCFSDNQYLGGAHGLLYMSYYVFNLKDGSIVHQEDILQGNYKEDLQDVLEDAVRDYLGADWEDLDLFSMPDFNDNFRVDDNGITWIYNVYEVAPYAAGVVEGTLSWDQLKPYLK